jgi:HEAT repeat protein
MNAWWGGASRQKGIRRADAFALARAHEASAIPNLLAIATDLDESPFARANALGYLGSFGQDPRVFPIFEWALGDSHPLPRVIAALGMPRGPGAVADLTRALRDPVATVRLAAAVSLVGAGVKNLPGEDGRRFEEARSLYFARAALNSDDGAQQVAAGRFFLLTGDASRAAESFANGIRIDPGLRGQTLEFLNRIGPGDPLYERAQTILNGLGTQ